MPALRIIVRVDLPTDIFDTATVTHTIGHHFKTFINELEQAFGSERIAFEAATEDASPKKRGRKPRRPRAEPTNFNAEAVALKEARKAS